MRIRMMKLMYKVKTKFRTRSLCLAVLAGILCSLPLTAEAGETDAQIFYYTGGTQRYVAPVTGAYKLEVWGASGYNAGINAGNGGLGGYAAGVVHLEQGQEIYVVVGGSSDGYNGGGRSTTGFGGGATHIGEFNSTLADHGSTQGLYLVAGGGGEPGCEEHNGDGDSDKDGGAGGGLTGGNGQGSERAGKGGTQTGGGEAGTGREGTGSAGVFGRGADGDRFGGSGGGGLYGGGSSGTAEATDEDGDDFLYGSGGGGGSAYTGSLEYAYTLPGIRKGNGKAVITPQEESISCEYPATVIWTCPSSGYYALEAWGARGGDGECDCDAEYGHGGAGGYAYGEAYITGGTVLTLVIGARGEDDSAEQATAPGETTGARGQDGGDSVIRTPAGIVYLKGDGGTGGADECYAPDENGDGGGDSATDGAPGSYYLNSVLVSNGRGEPGVQEGSGKIRIRKLLSEPAGGGSSHVNTDAGINGQNTAGVWENNGQLVLRSVNIGFVDGLHLDDVPAPDLAAPDKIPKNGTEITPVDGSNGSMVTVSWEEPGDNGTVYYHVAESHLARTGVKLCTSNITENTLTTGVAGYYYLLDTEEVTVPGAANGHFIGRTSRSIRVVLTQETQYLHIAPVDGAGNVGGASHVEIGAREYITNVPWALHTGQITLFGEENVYPAGEENTWYVRCDGATPFLLEFEAYMEGNATMEYQINRMIFESEAEGGMTARSVVGTPLYEIREGERETAASGLSFSVTGSPVLHNHTFIRTVHRNANRNVYIENGFLAGKEIHGKHVRITPVAGVVTDKYNVYSDYGEDLQNGIYIIGDLEAPVIGGMEVLEGVEVLDRSQGSFVLELTAEDELSGVREFYVEVYNMDNESVQTFRADGDGHLRLDLTSENAIFSGDFSITAVAVDNVGNESRREHVLTEFALTAGLERILAPHEPVFKRGESGRLTVSTWGYVERVEVEFPEELTALDGELNHIYTYEIPQYEKEEKLQFMIPLYVPKDGEYTIRVTAYKGDKNLEAEPELVVFTVEGTVLDELRTRLR